MRWFKMFSEARNDAKLRVLTDPEFRVWFNLLCFAAEQKERGIISGCSYDLLAVEVSGGDVPVLQSLIEKMTRLKMLSVELPEDCKDEPIITFVNFAERQSEKPSQQPSSVAERVRRHRAAKAQNEPDVTPRNALQDECNDDETPQNKNRREENRVEENTHTSFVDSPQEIPSASPTNNEKIPKSKVSKFTDAEVEELYGYYPRKTNRRDALSAIERALRRIAQGEDKPDWFQGQWPPPAPVSWLRERIIVYAQSPKGQPPTGTEDFRPHPATWMNRAAYSDHESEWQRGYNGNGTHQPNPKMAAAPTASERRAKAWDDWGAELINQSAVANGAG